MNLNLILRRKIQTGQIIGIFLKIIQIIIFQYYEIGLVVEMNKH